VRCLESCDLGLLLGHPFLHECVILCLLFLLAIKSATLERVQVTAALETHGCDEPLDFGCLGIGFGILLLRALHLSPDDILPNIILLAQVEELPDLSSPLRSQPLRQHFVRQPRDFALTLLHDDQTQHGDIRANDAAPNGFTLAFTGAAGTIARMAIGEEELDTVGEEDTLFHGESLLVIATSNTEDVAFPFVTKGVGRNLLGDFLFVEDTVSLLIINIDEFLFPCSGVGDVELHTW